MKHKRKLYYPVGLLSLSVLLFMFVVHVLNDYIAHPRSILEVNSSYENYDNYLSDKKKKCDIDIPPEGNWNVFTFSGDEKKNTKTFDSLRVAIEQFILSRDSLRGIEIVMSRKMSYSRFVMILDMLRREKADQYKIINSTIWVPRFPFYSKPQYDRITLDDCVIIPSWPYHVKVRRSKELLEQWEVYFRDELTKIPLSIMLAWLGLFSLNIVRLIVWRNVNDRNYVINKKY